MKIMMNNLIVFKLEKLKDKVKNHRINKIKIILEMEQTLIRIKFVLLKGISIKFKISLKIE